MLLFLSVTNQHLDNFFLCLFFGFICLHAFSTSRSSIKAFQQFSKVNYFEKWGMYVIISFLVCSSRSVQWWVSQTASIQTTAVILTYDLPIKTDSVICTYGLPAVAMGPKHQELQSWSNSLCIITPELCRRCFNLEHKQECILLN